MLTIHSSKNFCAVHAHRASTETAIKRFTSLVADAPYPLIATQVKNEQTQDVVNGPVQTVSYEWSTPGAPLKLLFTLSTAPSDSAELQVLGSAAVIPSMKSYPVIKRNCATRLTACWRTFSEFGAPECS